MVATPIGNLEDITLRALRILKEVNLIACEDTRQTRKLLDHFGIQRATISYHDHNEASRSEEIIERVLHGESVALVSDAGTPLIEDPGYRLVCLAIEQNIPVVPIPGASSLLCALAGSGLSTDSFHFGGFLPPKTGKRCKVLDQWKDLPATLIFFETPHRILEALDDVTAVMGARPIVVGRELTKLHEEFLRGTAASIRQQLAERPAIKGEMVLLIGKAEATVDEDISLEDAFAEYLAEGMSRMDAIKAVARRTGKPKREVYRVLDGEARD